MPPGRAVAAYMEDADELSGQIREGTRVAASVAPNPKERANSKKSRRSGSTSPIVYGQTDSDSTIHPRKRDRDSKPRPKDREREREHRERDREREREKDHRRSSSKNLRPPPRTNKTAPVIHTSRKPSESEYYGVQPANASSQRFRSNTSTQQYPGGGVPITSIPGGRSMSYHGSRPHPPPSNAGFYAAHPSHQLSTSPFTSSMAMGPYPPVYGSSYGSTYGGPPPPPSHSPLPPPSPVDNYLEAAHSEHLKQRFHNQARPASSIGFRQTRRTSSYYDDQDEEEEAPVILTRKFSTKGNKDMQDRKMMPPPPRPKSTKPIVLRPPPPQTHVTRGYDDESSFDGDGGFYRDVDRRDMVRRSGDFGPPAQQGRSRRMSMAAADAALQLQSSKLKPRPNSTYDVDEYDQDYEYGYTDHKMAEQLMKAGQYQDTINGGLTHPLTKDALQKAGKRSQGSSRSTRSSESHDESEWRHSATTRTTRSVAGEEDVTIKVTGQAVVEVSGAKIQCRDGSAISISSRPIPTGRLIDSDRGSVAYDDRKTRIERLPHRTRAMSQSGSYPRTHAVYDYPGEMERHHYR